MDMELSEQQQHLIDTARRFMENECPLSAVREQEDTETGFSLELWQKMGELGWLGLPFPEQYGGYGLGNADLARLSKEMGRSLCPSPYIPSVVLAGGAILAAGSEEQKSNYLQRIGSGQTVVAFALLTPCAGAQDKPELPKVRLAVGGKVLKVFDPAVAGATVDLGKTHTGTFVEKALAAN